MRSPLAVGWAAASQHGLTAFNQLAVCTELGRSQELLQTGNTRYIDISNIGVITILKNAVDEIARRPEVDEIMLDDNFGVISKTSKKVNPVTGEEVFFLETDYKRLFSDDGSMRFVTEKITDSLKTIKNQIDMVNQNTGKNVKLSMSV
ncbi:MAG: hypothetical protein AAF329_18200 [Cyanobacteria bacterium P01_A01_bin.17]